jgi:hypothetical protein
VIEQELQRIRDDEHATKDERDAAELLLSGQKPDQHIASVLVGWCARNAFTQNRYGK